MLVGTEGFQPYLIIGMIETSDNMLELSIIDYMIWAVQRKLLKGEARFYEALKGKYETIVTLYPET